MDSRDEIVARIDARRESLGLPNWRCSHSPSGAHHWKHIFGTKWWVCLYCADSTNKFDRVGSNSRYTRHYPHGRYYPTREEVNCGAE